MKKSSGQFLTHRFREYPKNTSYHPSHLISFQSILYIYFIFLSLVLIYEAVDLPFCLVPIVIKTIRLRADVIHNAQTHSANGSLICFTLADVCLSAGHLPALSAAHKPHVRERGSARFCYDFG
ncbi:hypothetical protein NPIL_674871 [Nephila pilipes]|uniref:Uncharacterized protein n=1 Tax=Nephila pilipes TaxID=299642 RepID=A0A8X6NAH6_NEPPI|nr:hypothetical protein NPIL_674871 [Nephila pilipes]